MRSWVKDPEILDDPKDFTYISLFKSMVYDYEKADLAPIERSAITYILVNWREMILSNVVREEVEEIVNKFVAENSVQIADDLINAINNAGTVQDLIQILSRLDQ
jgi:hypothetical protein|uniref:Uncharacterized protein n=2 Tax=unclassified Caudoviricetes TaxID=2788787 RepID=A0A8S5LTK9_9CAUD|nr:MAG TPA: hypothetical protein [Siphoviridae sp. ctKm44]DAE09898.1 MAG TPA: hypothetical protein [Siphoviridae sp. ctJdE31]